jgi:hypothetical protein
MLKKKKTKRYIRYSTDDIIRQAIKEKHSFESHKNDICYACHHKKVWIHINIEERYDEKTMTLSQMKKIIDKQLKVK